MFLFLSCILKLLGGWSSLEHMHTPQTQNVALVQETGDPSVLRPSQAPVPPPGAHELLVKTRATGVNFIETYQRAGVYSVKLPFIPGGEACGIVEAVGDQVSEFSVGDRITTASATQTYGEFFTVPEEFAAAVPDEISDEIAAALPLQGMTAHYLTRSTFAVNPEHTVLLHAGAGGVGGIAIQLLKSIGATVITTVSTEEKKRIALNHGADHVLFYDNFAEETLEITQGKGVDVAYDSVGKTTFDQTLKTLKTRGTAVLFGGASGQVPPFDLQQLNALGSLYVTRPTLAHYTLNRPEFLWRMNELFDRILAKELTVTIDQIFPLTQASQAHEFLEGRHTRGKVLLMP